jgi:hypothetical protein
MQHRDKLQQKTFLQKVTPYLQTSKMEVNLQNIKTAQEQDLINDARL